MSSNTRLITHGGCFLLNSVGGVGNVHGGAHDLLFPDDQKCYKLSSVVMNHNNATDNGSIPGMQEIFNRISRIHPSPILTTTLDHCDRFDEADFPIARHTCSTPQPHSIDTHNLDAFESSSPSAVELADFSSTLITSTLSDFSSFSCEPTNSSSSSPNGLLGVSDCISRNQNSLTDCDPCHLQLNEVDDDETDIVPSELVQFVSESSQRIQSRVADAVSVVDSDMEDFDHDAPFASLCLPILQPPSLVSSHASDSMRPPSLSPEPITEGFTESDFSKAYFTESMEVDKFFRQSEDSHSMSISLGCTPPETELISDTPLVLNEADHFLSENVDMHASYKFNTKTSASTINNHGEEPNAVAFAVSNASSQQLCTRKPQMIHVQTSHGEQKQQSFAVMKSSALSFQSLVGNGFVDLSSDHDKLESVHFSDGTKTSTPNTHYCMTAAVQNSFPSLTCPVFSHEAQMSECAAINNLDAINQTNMHKLPCDATFVAHSVDQVCLSKRVQLTKPECPIRNGSCGSALLFYPTDPSIDPYQSKAINPTNGLQTLLTSDCSTSVLSANNDKSAANSDLISPSTFPLDSFVYQAFTGMNDSSALHNINHMFAACDKSSGDASTSDHLFLPQNPSCFTSNPTTVTGRSVAFVVPTVNRLHNNLFVASQPQSSHSALQTDGVTLQLLSSLPTLRPGMSVLLNLRNGSINSLSGSGIPLRMNVTTSNAGLDKMLLLPNSGSSFSAGATLSEMHATNLTQQRLGAVSSTLHSPLVMIPTVSTSNTVSSGVTPIQADPGMTSFLGSSVPLPVGTQVLLLRPALKPQRGCSISTLDNINTNSGIPLLVTHSSPQKTTPDSTNLLLIPSLLPTVGTDVSFPVSNCTNIQQSDCASGSPFISTPSLTVPTSQNAGVADIGFNYTNLKLGQTYSTLLHATASSLTNRFTPHAQSPFAFPVALLPNLNAPTAMFAPSWDSSMNGLSQPHCTVAKRFLSPLPSLSTYSSSPGLLSTLSSPSLPVSYHTAVTDSNTTCMSTSTLLTLLCSNYSLTGGVNTASSVSSNIQYAGGLSNDPDCSQSESKKTIVLPSADNLLSSRSSTVSSTPFMSPILIQPNKSLDTKYPLNSSVTCNTMSTSTSDATSSPCESLTHMSNSSRRRHQCPYCPKSCERKDNLQAHIRTHTGERPYPCRFCPKAFPQKDHLRAHIRTHTGEKPYRCSQCLKAFAQLGNLHRHVKTHRR